MVSMKKGIFWVGALALSMAVGGVTAYSVTKTMEKQKSTVKNSSVSAPASFASKAGSHFTSYDQGSYPDLTYAAENAVKAVVNIVNTRESTMRNGYANGGYEQFFDFFGIPRGQFKGQQPRVQKSGGSGVIISPDGYIVTNNTSSKMHPN